MTTLATVDVAVIGAGIVGSAIARDLAGRHLSVALIEGRDDVGDGTSKANTAILHTGFDASPGTLESRLVARGYVSCLFAVIPPLTRIVHASRSFDATDALDASHTRKGPRRVRARDSSVGCCIAPS